MKRSKVYMRVQFPLLNCWCLPPQKGRRLGHLVDPLLHVLEIREEYHIDKARSSHRDADAGIHISLEELDPGPLNNRPLADGQAIPLIVRFGRIDWINLCKRI